MICVQMLFTDSWKELSDITYPSLIRYATQHDYSWNVKRIGEPYDGFEKLRQILKCFESPKCTTVLSLDSDAIITDRNKKIEDFLDKEYDAIFGQDINGLNCGIFFITKTEWSESFLKTLLSYQGDEGMECEQNAVDRYIKEHGMDRIKITDGFNDYPLNEYYPSYGRWNYKYGEKVRKPENEWTPLSYIIHTPGLEFNKRINILKLLQY